MTTEIETTTKQIGGDNANADGPSNSGGAVVADRARARKISAMRAAEVLTSLKASLTEWSRF